MDFKAEVSVLTASNGNGRFIKLLIDSHAGKSSKVALCFPCGVDGCGWKRLGEAVASILGHPVEHLTSPKRALMSSKSDVPRSYVAAAGGVAVGGSKTNSLDEEASRSVIAAMVKEVRFLHAKLDRLLMEFLELSPLSGVKAVVERKPAGEDDDRQLEVLRESANQSGLNSNFNFEGNMLQRDPNIPKLNFKSPGLVEHGSVLGRIISVERPSRIFSVAS